MNIAPKLILVMPLLHVRLAAATSAGAWVYAGILAAILWRQNRLHMDIRMQIVAIAALGGGTHMATAIFLFRDDAVSAFGGILRVSPLLGPFIAKCAVFAAIYLAVLFVGWRATGLPVPRISKP